MTSGYNVGEDIYLRPQFNDLCGFTEAEVAAVLRRLASESGDWSPEGALATMRTFYNGYRFSEEATESLYNPTLSLYFLKALEQQGGYPRRMLDENLAMDRNKLIYIAQLAGGEALLIGALAGDDRVVIPELVQRFGVADVLAAVKDQPFMASLLYFFGILTLAGVTDFDECRLRIPNLVARALYAERLRERWLGPTQLSGADFDVDVSWHRFNDASGRVDPKGMFRSLTFKIAPGAAQAFLEKTSFHAIVKDCRTASAGRLRRQSSRRSSISSLIAARRFSVASSIVSPCPLAPGNSGQTAQYPPSGADSIMAVTSPFIDL
jgi:hypothetical protein